MKRFLICFLLLAAAAGCGDGSGTVAPAQVGDQERKEFEREQQRVHDQESQRAKNPKR